MVSFNSTLTACQLASRWRCLENQGIGSEFPFCWKGWRVAFCKATLRDKAHFEEWHLFIQAWNPNMTILEHIIPGSPSLEFGLKMDVCMSVFFESLLLEGSYFFKFYMFLLGNKSWRAFSRTFSRSDFLEDADTLYLHSRHILRTWFQLLLNTTHPIHGAALNLTPTYPNTAPCRAPLGQALIFWSSSWVKLVNYRSGW